MMILIKRKSRRLHLPEECSTYMVQITLIVSYNQTRRILWKRKDSIIKKADKRREAIGEMSLQSLTALARTPQLSTRSQSSTSDM